MDAFDSFLHLSVAAPVQAAAMRLALLFLTVKSLRCLLQKEQGFRLRGKV